MPLYWLMKLNMTKERSRNIISHSTDFSTTTIKQQQQQQKQQNHQYSQHLEDNMGHISTLSIVETTTEVIDQNDKTQNQNFNEKSILSDKNLCNNNSNNNNNNNKKDNQNAINNNNNFNNYNNDNGTITTTTTSSSNNNNLFDQNNNDGKKYKTIVTNKSKLNICNNEKCKNIKLSSSSSSSSIDKTLQINENNVNGSNKNDNKSSDNNDNDDDDNGKLLRRSCLNEKIYEDWKGDKVFGIQFKAPLKWDKIFAITALHLVFVYCVFTYTSEHHNWKTTIWAILCGGFAGFGVTAGAHRLWTHRAYKATTFLRILLIMCFSLSGQNTLYDWVRDHRVHHKFSETDADPHNANRGFFFAHVGWLMMYKHPDVIKRGRQMDMTDILSDPVVQFHQRNFVIMKTLFCFVLPIMPPVLIWHDTLYNAIVTQCIFRYVLCLNFTWSVNSAAHMWGTRPYDRKIQPAENLIVSLLAFGEGWHNYHHVFPWDYKAAELGNYSVNLSTLFIDLFSKLGWAYDMKQPSKELIRRTIEKCGDGTHPVFGHHLSEVPIPAEENIDENLNVYEKTY